MDEEKAHGVLAALGTMSGTSLDGVDAAVVLTDGVAIHGFGPSDYRAYGANEVAILRAALGAWPGEDGVAAAADLVTAAHADLLKGFDGIDLIGFHGQTFAHEPRGRGTHQAGDGQALADTLRRPVVWDFRSADVAAGGEGAPLAPVFHWALARWIGAQAPVAFLNLGGVGNLTWTDPGADDPFAPGALLAFDTGPANAPVNDLVMRRRGWAQDAGGALALEGRAHMNTVIDVLGHRHFQRVPPKSLDRDAFPDLSDRVTGMTDADAAATLVRIAAEAVAAGMAWCPSVPARLLVTGGGRHNRAMMAALAELLPCEVVPVEAAGLDGDMLEAQAFAYLAVRALHGLPISGPGTTGVAAPLTGGRISWPDPAAD
ncbi:anhydro-N-acetylmuramic acid kinase [Mangrovicoccus algicola]|uniref:Anhydro-N-acetylmuramic acid kinase n=1 Tax=Mangrovicoccus algicola TaxID=2771008 RepID=A0A8J6YZK1_9RHOB|nr:anhydro-N-acetylmuramic acid kinase [Mangrovicoccus algicola]MBE3638753.1 anhydro-N-acetylmuramic acid kinase [Mangrovicoccus algicola]